MNVSVYEKNWYRNRIIFLTSRKKAYFTQKKTLESPKTPVIRKQMSAIFLELSTLHSWGGEILRFCHTRFTWPPENTFSRASMLQHWWKILEEGRVFTQVCKKDQNFRRWMQSQKNKAVFLGLFAYNTREEWKRWFKQKQLLLANQYKNPWEMQSKVCNCNACFTYR